MIFYSKGVGMSVPGTNGEEIIVLKYEFIDDEVSIRKAEDFLSLSSENLALLEKVKAAFKESGWAGDGEIGLFWIPPFFYTAETTYGTWVWHVKQHDNGTSFLGFNPDGLNFVRNAKSLIERNDRIFNS
jgi:hypothetical protein